MGILMGALAGAGRAAGEIADTNTRRWDQQALAEQNAQLEMAKMKMAEELRNSSAVATENRGLLNRAKERKDINDETIANAPGLRQIKTDDYKAGKMAEYDPEIQALMRKAETDKLTSAEQAQLDFYQKNRGGILKQKRDMAQAGNIDNGAGLRGLQMQAAQMSIDERKEANGMMKEYETTQDPARKTSIRDALINRGILKPSGSSEYDTEKISTEKMNPDGSTTKTERMERRRATDKPAENDAPPDGTHGVMNGVAGTVKNGKFVPDGEAKPAAEKPSKRAAEPDYVPPSDSPAGKRLAEINARQGAAQATQKGMQQQAQSAFERASSDPVAASELQSSALFRYLSADQRLKLYKIVNGK